MVSRKPNPKEIEAVLTLDAPTRYEHFVKQVADRDTAWGLWSEGWAMGADDQGNPTFPFWPSPEYATLCAKGKWEGFEVAEIPLDDLIDELLPKLRADGVQPSVFQTPSGQSVMPSIDQLIEDLLAERARY
jgi:hypothetical protein